MSLTVGQVLQHPNLRYSMEQYAAICKIPMIGWQLDDWETAWAETTCCFCRSRGGSKTRDFTYWLIYRVLRMREDWAWLASKAGQLRQALKYVQTNPFVKSIQRITPGKNDVHLYGGKSIRFGIVSTSNLGLRMDGIIFDEFENLQPKQELEEYPQMPGMMTASPIHKMIYLGTLWINTLFNEYCDIYPHSIHPWEESPWLVAAGMIQQEIDAGITPEWELDLLYRCIPALPGGVVFPNLKVGALPDLAAELYGIDFGATDHLVGCYIDDGICYVMEEREVDFDRFPDCFDWLNGQAVEAEDGFYNIAKAEMLSMRISTLSMRVTREWKAKRVAFCRSLDAIVVDPDRTPNIYKDIKGASFGEDGLYLKDRNHPCHWLDAFLHAVQANRRRYFESQGVRSARIRKQERRRALQRGR